MLPVQRRARVIEILRKEEIVSLRDLASAVPTSLSSLRRDIDYLEDAGFLEKTRGGVILKHDQMARVEPEPDLAAAIESDAKAEIGKRAAQLIQSGQNVIFDSGSTTLATARIAASRGLPFHAITNDIRIAAVLSTNSRITVEVSGGRLRPGSSTLLGPDALRTFMRLRTDLAFIGAHAVDDTCFSDSSVELADLKGEIIRAAKFKVLVADYTKFGQRSLCSIGEVGSLNRIVTDRRLDSVLTDHYRSLGIEIDIADEPVQ